MNSQGYPFGSTGGISQGLGGLAAPRPSNLGWECPKCGRCYAPSNFACFSCGPAMQQQTSGTCVADALKGHLQGEPIGEKCCR